MLILGAPLLLVSTARPAFAADLGAPPSTGGWYAQCNSSTTLGTNVSTGQPTVMWVRIKCNYGGDAGTNVGQVRWQVSETSPWTKLTSAQVANNGDALTASAACGATYPGGWTNLIDRDSTAQTFEIRQCQARSSGADSRVVGAGVYNGNFSIYRPFNLQTNDSAGVAPSYPADFYTGGTPGPVAVADPLVPCSRSINTTAGGQPQVTFDAGTSTVTGRTDEFDWDFGDSSSGEGVITSHLYTATPPAGGWTATVTVTGTASAGYQFANGSSESIVTCSLRVDPSAPSESTPGGVTPGDGTDDQDCPSGWGWLNPASIGSILKCLFVPSDGFEDTATDAIGDGGISSLVAPVGAFNEFVYNIGDAQTLDTGGDPTDCHGPVANIEYPEVGGMPEETQTFAFFDACEGTIGHTISGYSMLFSKLAILFIAIGVIKKFINSIIGGTTDVAPA